MLFGSLACQQESMFVYQALVPKMSVNGCKAARGM